MIKRTNWLNTVRRLQITNHITLLEESTKRRSLAILVEVQLPHHLTRERCLHRLSIRVQDSTFIRSSKYLHGLTTGSCFLHALQQVLIELLLGLTRLILTVLLLVHSELKELFIVLTTVPAFLFHLGNKLWQYIWIKRLWITRIEFHILLLSKLNNLWRQCAWQLTRLAENHAPHSRVHACEWFLAHRLAIQIHQRCVLHILREWSYETRRTKHRPNTLYLIKELDK